MALGNSILSGAPTDVAIPKAVLLMAPAVTPAAAGGAVDKALRATAVVPGVPAVVPGVPAVVPGVLAVVPGVIAVVPGVLAVMAAGLGGAATTAVDGVDETTVSADGFFAIGTCTTVRGCTSGACSSV